MPTEQSNAAYRDIELRLLHFDIAGVGRSDIGLRSGDFAEPGYRGLFPAWREALGAGLAADIVSLDAHLRRCDPPDEQVLGALEAVRSLPGAGLTQEGAQAALKSLRLARTKDKAREAADRFKANLEDPFAVLGLEADRLHTELLDLVPPPLTTMPGDVTSIIAEEAAAIQDNRQLFYPTGLEEFDSAFGGLSNEGMTLVIGVSGHGKTTTLNRLAFGLACNGYRAYLHATESSREQRIRDLVYSVAGLNQIKCRTAPNKDAIVRRLKEAADMVGDLPWEVTGSGMGIDEICAKIRADRMAGKLDAAFIDYLQDIPATGRYARLPRVEFVGQCSQMLKDTAAELQIPIVVGAQAEKPTLEKALLKPRPGMFSSQWGSKAPQDAEEVYTLYLNDAFKKEWGDSWTVVGLPGVLEVTKRKARRTECGTALIDFRGETRWLGEKPAL